MLIYFVTDVHGSELCYRKFLNAARFYEADVIILGGDITGKHVVPYWEGNGGYLVGTDEGAVEADREHLDEVLQTVRDHGGYPFRTSPEEVEEVTGSDLLLEQLLSRLKQESIERWLTMADERLGGTGVRCFISPGNDDPTEIDPLLDQASTVENPEDRVVALDERFSMITCGMANPTPWHSERERSEEQLEEHLTRLAAQLAEPKRAIFNIHVPPYNTSLDSAPLLDETKKPVVSGGQVQMTHVGSKAVRNLIERYRPPLGLHGHVHEARGVWRWKDTLCLNPGSEYLGGVLRGALITIDARKGVRNYQLVQG
jgi:Icc-related predicted phosphoesterase